MLLQITVPGLGGRTRSNRQRQLIRDEELERLARNNISLVGPSTEREGRSTVGRLLGSFRQLPFIGPFIRDVGGFGNIFSESERALEQGVRLLPSIPAPAPGGVGNLLAGQGAQTEEGGQVGTGGGVQRQVPSRQVEVPPLVTPRPPQDVGQPVGIPTELRPSSQAEEMSGIGKALAAVGKALGTPGVQQILGQFGVAFGGGFESSPATQLGRAAISNAQARAEREALGTLLAGGSLEDLPESTRIALTGEGLQRAIGAAQGQRRLDIAEEGLEVDRERIASQEKIAGIRAAASLAQTNAQLQKDLRVGSAEYDRIGEFIMSTLAGEITSVLPPEDQDLQKIEEMLNLLGKGEINFNQALARLDKVVAANPALKGMADSINTRFATLMSTAGNLLETGQFSLTDVPGIILSGGAQIDSETAARNLFLGKKKGDIITLPNGKRAEVIVDVITEDNLNTDSIRILE